MNYKVGLFLLIFFGVLVLGIAILGVNDALFVLPSKSISTKNVVKEPINKNIFETNINKFNPKTYDFNPKINVDFFKKSTGCEIALKNLKPNSDVVENRVTSATSCYKEENKTYVAYRLTFDLPSNKHFDYSDCLIFTDSCDSEFVNAYFCEENPSSKIFEESFYRNVSEELKKMRGDLTISQEVAQQLEDDYNIDADELMCSIKSAWRKAIENPKRGYLFLFPNKIKEVGKKTILENLVYTDLVRCNNSQYCLYGQCKDYAKVDLYVGNISDNVRSEQCSNTIEFELCNKGEDVFNSKVDILVEANSKIVEYEYNTAKKGGPIEPGKCVKTTDYGLNIFAFGLDLDSNANVKIIVNKDKKLYETEYNNNESISKVYTLDNFYNENKPCQSWCYDSDAKIMFKGVFDLGQVFFKTNLGIPDFMMDVCLENNLFVKEYSCKNGKLYFDEFDCRYYGNLYGSVNRTRDLSGKCVNGVCVPIETPDLTICEDSETGANVYEKGEIQHRPPEGGLITTISDTCLDEFTLKEYSCNISPQSNLPYLHFYNTTCKVGCYDGACIESKNIGCIDTDNGENYEVPGMVVVTYEYLDPITKETKTKDWKYTDACFDEGSGIVETICKNGSVSYVKKGNLIAENKACVTLPEDNYIAKIIDIPFEKESCIDSDNGIDIFNFGTIKYTNFLGIENTFNDVCVEGKNEIRELYCKDKKPEFYIAACPEGYGCNDGVCKELVAEESCIDSDNGDNGLIEGYVTHINEFNEELEYNDYCLTDYEVYESYCEGSKPLYKIIKCPENYACNKNKCQQITSEKKCETLTNYNNLGFDGVKVTDFFGNVDLQFDYCKNNLLNVVSCSGNTISRDTKNCLDDNLFCKSTNNQYGKFGKCAPGDLSNINCIDSDGENIFSKGKVEYTDLFGDTYIYGDFCISDYEVQEQICVNNESSIKIFTCPEGYLCNNLTSACEKPITEQSCEIFGDLYTGIYSIFTNGFESNEINTSRCNYFDNTLIGVPKCYDTFSGWQTVSCPEGYGCTNTNILIDGEKYNAAKCVLPNPDLEVCYDSDDENIFKVGLTNGTNMFGLNFEYFDACDSETTIVEHICNSNKYERKLVSCPPNHICVNKVVDILGDRFIEGSKCVLDKGAPVITKCTDSDASDESLPGLTWLTTNYDQIGDAHKDYCRSENEVVEFYCDNLNISQKTTICPENYICDKKEFFISELAISERAGTCVPKN